jgi:GAF domain-containing protein
MQQVAAFSAAAASLIPQLKDARENDSGAALLKRFGAALNLDTEMLGELVATAAREVRVLVDIASLGPGEDLTDVAADATETTEQGLPRELLLDRADHSSSLQVSERHASGKPFNARDLLLAGVQDVTQMTASGKCKVNDLMLLVLETLYSGLGFRFATVSLQDVRTGQFRARIAMGERAAQRQAGFVFPAPSEYDLFHLALDNNVDLMIADAATPKIHDLLPAWHRKLLPDARSFIVLPLVINKHQIGLFYADRAQPAPEGVPPDETALIKTLKGQVLTALNSH